MDAARQVRLILVGAGNVGRRFLELLVLKRDTLRQKLGVEFVVAGVADSSGVAICAAGLEPQALIDLKLGGRGVASSPDWGRPGGLALDMVQTADADLLLVASPGNLTHGQPGLGCIEAGLSRGMHVVTADKAPLVLAFPRLLSLAESRGVKLCFDATVAGGLPTVNLGRRDLAGACIYRMEGILNLTANYILTRMADDSLPFEQALAEAQAAGHAETDPSLDIEGWDAAEKLVILAHSVLGYPATLRDVAVEGIARLTPDLLRQAHAQGNRVKLLATAEQQGDSYQLSVRPASLRAGHPLAQLGPEQMGILFYTDVCGVLAASIVEQTPMPTAFAMLRDVLSIYVR